MLSNIVNTITTKTSTPAFFYVTKESNGFAVFVQEKADAPIQYMDMFADSEFDIDQREKSAEDMANDKSRAMADSWEAVSGLFDYIESRVTKEGELKASAEVQSDGDGTSRVPA